jgi:O-antigen/teichoic acid export membrane protein
MRGMMALRSPRLWFGAGSGERIGRSGRSIVKNFSSALYGNAVYTSSQFVMLLLLTHLGTPLQVGEYALALAITGPIYILAGLKLSHVFATDAAESYAPGEYFALRVATSWVGLLAACLIACIGPFPPSLAWVIVTVAVYKGIEAQIDILYGAMQRKQQLHLVARSQVVRGLGGVLAFALGLLVSSEVAVAVACLSAFTLLQGFFVCRRVRRIGTSLRLAWHHVAIRRLAILAFPVGVAVTVGSLTVNVPRYLIEAYGSTADVGVFAVLGYVLVATSTVAGALSDAAAPQMADLYANGDRQTFLQTLRNLVFVALGIGLFGVLVVLIVGHQLLDFLFGPRYSNSADVLLVLMVAAAVQYASLYLGTAVNAMRLFTVQLPINLTGLLVVALSCWVAIPRIGLIGAGLGVLAGQLAQGICYVVLLRRVILPRLCETV